MISRSTNWLPDVDSGRKAILRTAAGDHEVLMLFVKKTVTFVVRDDPTPSTSVKVFICFDGFEVQHSPLIETVRTLTVRGETFFAIECRRDPRLEAICDLQKSQPNLGAREAIRLLQPRDASAASRPRWRPALSLRGMATGAALVLAALVFALTAYQKLVLSYTYGFVTTADVEFVRAESSGVFYSYVANDRREVKSSDLIGFLDSSNGRTLAITSPCECVLGDLPLRSGSPIFKGTIVARLIPMNASLDIRIPMSLEAVSKVAIGDQVTVALPGGRERTTARISSIRRTMTTDYFAAASGSPAAVEVEVLARPTSNLPVALIGTEVIVQFSRVERLRSLLGV